MPPALIWSEDQDSRLRRMRASGASWDAIAAGLGISRWAAIERGRRIGATTPPRVVKRIDPLAVELSNPCRDPLPAGHAFAWALLTHGTLLEGTPYPWPPLPPDDAGDLP